MVDPRRIDPSVEHPEGHGRDPEESWEEQFSESEREFGRPPVTEPYSPGKDPTILPPLPEDIFTPPSDAVASKPTPEKDTFKNVAADMQTLFNDPVSLILDPVTNIPIGSQALRRWNEAPHERLDYRASSPELQRWNEARAKAFEFRACLADLWADYADAFKNTFKDGNEQEEQGAFDNFLKDLEGLRSMLDDWDRERRKYPYNWDGLNKLGTELNNELRASLKRAEELGFGKLKTTLGAAAGAADQHLRVIAFELGRQGNELGSSKPVDYGSAPEAVASSFVALTQQNDAANFFRAAGRSALAKSWTTTCGKLTNVKKELSVAWDQAIQPMNKLLSDWATAANSWSSNFQEFSSATAKLRKGISTERSLLLDNDPTMQKVPKPQAYRKDNARDGLEVLNDEIVKRLQDMIASGDLDLEETKTLEVEVNSWRKLRHLTTTEKAAQTARDRGLSDFWSDSKAQILKDIVAEADGGKALSDQLNKAFSENLSELLDTWTTESKKIPKHDPVALHDAAWKLRFAIRRYRRSVNGILRGQEGFRQRLLTALDGLQFALAGQIRDYRQQGYHLF
jgi:hypothetical protein